MINKCCDQLREYELSSGSVVQRQQEVLEQFEVFRAPWASESSRMKLEDEWEALKECYVAADC
jgi:hypothetical protein